MIQVRKAGERGEFRHGGLVSYHTFSFGDYYDERHMGFRSLRVINDDTLAGGFGFPTHPHRDMEIVTYVTSGVIEHRDSIGNTAQIKSGELQRMTAGSGVSHSEYNASETHPAKLLQIWLLPERRGLKPGYEQKMFVNQAAGGAGSGLSLAVSPDGAEESLRINQDARIYLGRISATHEVSIPLHTGRFGWIQMIDGTVDVGGETLAAGDGAALSGLVEPQLRVSKDAHFLFFDLA